MMPRQTFPDPKSLLLVAMLALVSVEASAQGRGRGGRGRGQGVAVAARPSASLSSAESSLFLGAGWCAQCHQGDGFGLIVNGEDVSPVTQWRSTMMAHAAKDPVWRAAVAAEVTEHPTLKGFIEDKCTRCHAPMGRTQAVHDGAERFSIDELVTDPLAQDGVSCSLCHQIQKCNFGETSSFTGGYHLHTDREIFGPYADPFTGPMINHLAYVPKHGPHVGSAELCATCHTLFTPILDKKGNVVGEFPEQTPYLEWKNSRYRTEGKPCQGCHMPQRPEAIDIATRPPWHGTKHKPYWTHDFVGGNTLVTDILRRSGESLQAGATPAHFDHTIAKARQTLRKKTVDLSASHRFTDAGLLLTVAITNRTGHKLPTGIPFRRLWLHVSVTDGTGTRRFESGAWGKGGQIKNLDSPFEPHHAVITAEHQVQVYEAIMADADGKATLGLLHAASYLKDNRLPPAGFTTTHADYATCRIAGRAAEDKDFNRKGSGEGTGTDLVEYRIPLPRGAYRVVVEACYQVLSPRFVKRLFTFETPESVRLKTLLRKTDLVPTVIASVTLKTDA